MVEEDVFQANSNCSVVDSSYVLRYAFKSGLTSLILQHGSLVVKAPRLQFKIDRRGIDQKISRMSYSDLAEIFSGGNKKYVSCLLFGLELPPGKISSKSKYDTTGFPVLVSHS